MQEKIDHPTNTTLQCIDDSSHCTALHPEYRFLAFDDLLFPSRMIIYLTSTRFESDLEDKRRKRIAQQIEWDLKKRGCSLQVTVKRELEAVIEEANAEKEPEK